MPLSVGTRLGPYEILAPIGAGGMGEVYKARDTRLDRTVAVKVLAQQGSSPEVRQRFEREARTISQLSRPAHLRAVRRRAGGRDRLSRHGVSRGRADVQPVGQGTAAARANAALWHRDRECAGEGASPGNRPPGSEAFEPDGDEDGGQAPRLRAREGDGAGEANDGRFVSGHGHRGTRQPHAGRHGPRDPSIHGTGTSGRGRCGQPQRHLRVGRDPLRDGDGKEGVFRFHAIGAHLRDPARRPKARLADFFQTRRRRWTESSGRVSPRSRTAAGKALPTSASSSRGLRRVERTRYRRGPEVSPPLLDGCWVLPRLASWPPPR